MFFLDMLIAEGLIFYSDVKLSTLSPLSQVGQDIDHSLNNVTAIIQNLNKMEIY